MATSSRIVPLSIALGLTLLCAPRATAQTIASAAKPATSAPPATSGGAPEADLPPEEPTAPDSPRAAVTSYLELVHSQNYDEAAKYLDLPEDRKPDGPRLAHRLSSVLDRFSWIDVDKLSPKASGDTDDGLAPGYERIGTIPRANGIGVDAVRIVHKGGKPAWVFSRATVDKIDGWYDRLEDRWFLEHMPARLLRVGPKDLLWWQWIALPILLFLSGVAGAVLSFLSGLVAVPIVKRTRVKWDDAFVGRLRPPMTLAWGIVVAYLAVPLLVLYDPAARFVHQLLRAGAYFAFFWTLSLLVEVLGQSVLASQWGRHQLGSRGLVNLFVRVGKLVVVAMAVVAFLSALGYPVTSLVAGLGIGGLAIALAAQKTMENLFGAFSINADQPFQEGDLIKVDDVTGTVEAIGLRSTKIRTPERTIVTMPNGKLADTRVESFARRDHILFSTKLRLAHDTTPSQIRKILSEIERTLKVAPRAREESVVARFSSIGESSLDLDLSCVFQTSDFGLFQQIRQDVLLEIMQIVDRAGTSFALPASTVHVVSAAAAETKPPESSPRPNSARA